MNEDYQTQPAPTPNDHEPIVDQVAGDLWRRKALGTERYGVALQPFNGRDMLQDAYEEALDLVIYLRGEISEREMASEQPAVRTATELRTAIKTLLERAEYHLEYDEVDGHWIVPNDRHSPDEVKL